MAAFSVQELVRATEGALVSGDLGVPVAGVSIDSRTLQVGEAFFAIVGHRLNGHAFLADAAARGAACVVVHTLPDDPPANVPLVLVEDTRAPWAGWRPGIARGSPSPSSPSPAPSARPRPRS